MSAPEQDMPYLVWLDEQLAIDPREIAREIDDERASQETLQLVYNSIGKAAWAGRTPSSGEQVISWEYQCPSDDVLEVDVQLHVAGQLVSQAFNMKRHGVVAVTEDVTTVECPDIYELWYDETDGEYHLLTRFPDEPEDRIAHLGAAPLPELGASTEAAQMERNARRVSEVKAQRLATLLGSLQVAQ